ncbi:class I SAM-dependent methyltransferase [Christiangramia echinicola]|uniref:Methyltransferase domain-containing protein n=1 Tax=Christiangramia echinicola TaxID=279359 RepID=A0A1H1L2Z7_9FLAO|nr:hypothetical protein [Christiangramia echinicola]SDR68954.1 hypothetical protein SAMN04488552_0524 [Christiangramia echinicola]
MKKILRYIKNKIRHSANQLKIRKQAKATRRLRDEKQTDTNRWEKEGGFYSDWNERTSILGSMVRPGSRVLEFGAGNAFLRNELPKDISYTPSDIVKREEDFLVCDLNRRIEFDLSQFDTVIFSGVLEYIYDIENVFDQFPKNITTVLLSYSCSDICKVNRLENRWLSDFSRSEVEKIFSTYDFQTKEYREWRGQSIFWLEKVF